MVAPASDSVLAFISELIRDANEIHRLSMPERCRMLQRAAATIRDYREQIAFSDAPANDTPGDIASDLAAMGQTPEAFTAGEISKKLLHAADTIKTLRVLMEEKGRDSAV